MWKSLSSAMNKFVASSFEQATAGAAGKKANPFANDVVATIDRQTIESQFQNALQLMQAGNAPMAIATMQAVVQQAAEACQKVAVVDASSTAAPSVAAVSPMDALYADACFKEAIILMSCNQPELAEITVRKAIEVIPADEAAKKAQANYLSYRGELLTRLERFDTAELVLKQSIDIRKAVYGSDHPGYAVGQSVLAESLLAAGKFPQAKVAIDEAVRILLRARHERLPIDLALRGYIIKATDGDAAPVFEMWTDLSVGMQKTVVQHALQFARRFDAKLVQPLLMDLHALIDGRPEFDVQLLLALDVALANASRTNHDHALNVFVCKRMVERCKPIADRSRYVIAQQALAMAYEDAGHNEEVSRAYDEGTKVAREIGELALLSTTLRNYAEWCDQTGQLEKAETLYKEAASHGASSGDWSTHGRSSVAYGMFLMHHNRLEHARALLEEAIAHLPPNHEDFGVAQSHLQALVRGDKCDCELDYAANNLSADLDGQNSSGL